jgi:AraC-like DNA-binding protein
LPINGTWIDARREGARRLKTWRLAHLFKKEIGDAVSAIAEDVGFSSACYFSRQFHRHFGLSPRAYRVRMVNSIT